VHIRPAGPEDVPAVTAIYNAAIAERNATFETRPREHEEIAGWLEAPYPFIVVEDGGRVIGWARGSSYSERAVYAGVIEHAVYVDPPSRGRGAGRALLDALAEAAAARGVHKLTSRVFATNDASLRAHEAAGFRAVGIQHRHSRLEGAWVDCVLVERLIGDAAEP
jgi:phosphinothricin acetyltransferase